MPLLKELATDSYANDGTSRSLRTSWLVSCSAGQNPLNEPGVPGPGSDHPMFPGLMLDAYTGWEHISRDLGIDTYKISAMFSNDGRFKFPKPPQKRDTTDFKEFTESFTKVDYKVPMFRRRTERSVKPDGTEKIAYRWEPDPLERRINVRVIARTRVLTGYNLQVSQEISRHIDEVHDFFGAAWRMLPTVVDQTGKSTFEVSYKWQSDPGDPDYDTLASETRIVPRLFRPAFWRYVVIPSETLDDPPSVEVEPTYRPDNDFKGYQMLPGNPIDE